MLVAVAPLVSRYCINGHDIEYHLLRIESLKDGILMGRPFLKVNALFYGGAGYASSLFYSDLFMHIPALLRVIGFGIGKSFHIYTAIIFVLCYISTFYCVWKMSMSKFAATIAAVLLTLCPYHMDDMLVRTACGENAAFIFIPLAVYGIFNVVYEGMDKPWVFGLGMAGLILTHPATCILMFFVCVVAFLINIKVLLADPKLFTRLLVVSVLALLITSYQWLPMLEQFADAQFYVSNNWTDLFDAAIPFSDIASSVFPCVGFMLFALMIPRFFMSKKDYPILAFVDLMIIAALIFAVGTTNVMPWERVAKLFGFLQFPWRMFIMTSVFLAMADGIILRLFLDRIDEDKRRFAFDVVLVVVTAIMMQSAINHQNENSMGYYDYSDDYYSYKPFTANVIAGEWLPSTVTEPGSLVLESDKMTYDDGSAAEFTRYRAKIISDIKEEHDYVDVPFIYYKGYSAVIKDAEGNETKLEVGGDGENGMCRVELLRMTGELTVSYTGTILQKVSLIVSHLFILLIFDLMYLKNKYKKKLRMRAQAAGANLGKVACIVITALATASMTACNVPVAQSAGAYDPDEMIDYLKDVNDSEAGDDFLQEDPVRINYSLKGYDEAGKSYAVKIDETSGEQVISVILPDEQGLFPDGETHKEKGLYEKLIREEIGSVTEKYRTDSLENRIMHATDALLCLEVFPEQASAKKADDLAKLLAEDIVAIPESKIETNLDKYNCAAVLSKAAYVLTQWEQGKDAQLIAERYFKEAESSDDADAEPVASRLWAAAELYRLTGQKTYRSVVDAIAMDVIPEGFSYEEPGFFGLFAYLMAPYPTNYNVCTNMMSVVFLQANDLIKISVDNEFAGRRTDDKTLEADAKDGKRMMDEAFLVTMTNYVSVSVEYKAFVQNRLNFIFGANLSGVDLTEDDNVLADSPKLFVLIGLI